MMQFNSLMQLTTDKQLTGNVATECTNDCNYANGCNDAVELEREILMFLSWYLVEFSLKCVNEKNANGYILKMTRCNSKQHTGVSPASNSCPLMTVS